MDGWELSQSNSWPRSMGGRAQLKWLASRTYYRSTHESRLSAPIATFHANPPRPNGPRAAARTWKLPAALWSFNSNYDALLAIAGSTTALNSIACHAMPRCEGHGAKRGSSHALRSGINNARLLRDSCARASQPPHPGDEHNANTTVSRLTANLLDPLLGLPDSISPPPTPRYCIQLRIFTLLHVNTTKLATLQ
jgi:hypothetical protein